ncbi:MAG: hypothetical protein A2945_00950 [Candidatus Liptonbacteria bacterium RIFCSPLOWO2_01_FULL_52_25]|uniref:Elongation factor P C-terminal domain-containing protein n=1 Tax=Candidatus Liptonbacteria bacterium RIFCSPLOWO2_01_FULL_52_25 TaxID=1798650 RepID=A0A1G2CDD5_9BACT|nr:MAG: hypothetical protein A2945_00950 [Candidatus Liptonbacteria bacterium RIFCSPLOWO2_01_FULL_52_25]
MDGAPYEVLEVHFLRMQQRKAVVQTKIRNLITSKVLDRNFQSSDSFEEAEIEKKAAVFIYKKAGRGTDAVDEYWFNEKGNPSNRFVLSGDILGDPSTGSGQGKAQFLKPNTEVATMVFNDKVIKATLPVKMEFKVVEAPPSIKGNTAQGGTKVVTLEGGAKINAPLFINQDDLIRINTVTGEYVERVEKK